MTTALVDTAALDPAIIEQVILGGDLSRLPPAQKVHYYNAVCASVGLNPLTQPFAYIRLNNKEVLYVRKEATEQLRSLRKVSIPREGVTVAIHDGIYVVTVGACLPDGRSDVATGAVAIEGLKGEAKANAMLKAETKAKRRVTLSICGLGLLDESELDDAHATATVEPIPMPQRRSEKAAASLAAPPAASSGAAGPSPAADEPPPPLDTDPFLTNELPEPGPTARAARVPSTRAVPPPTGPGSDRSVEDFVILNTAYVTPKDTEAFYEITGREDAAGRAPIGYVFVTRDQALYELAQSCEGTGAIVRVTWHTAPRPDRSVAKILDTLTPAK